MSTPAPHPHADSDLAAYLWQVGVSCRVFSFNPLDARADFPQPVRWDIAKDVTSPARAMTFVAGLILSEQGGNNQYFSNAARQIVTAVVESFQRNSPGKWTFSDLVFATLSTSRIEEVLARDAAGQDVLDGLLEVFRSRGPGNTESRSEQRVEKQAVLPSQFSQIPVTSKENGLTGYFVSPEFGAVRGTVPGWELEAVVVSKGDESRFEFEALPDSERELRPWTVQDRQRLGLRPERVYERKKRLLGKKKQLQMLSSDGYQTG